MTAHTIYGPGALSDKILGLTLRGCGRTVYIRASSIITICESMSPGAHKPVHDFTFITLVNLTDDSIEVQERALDIIAKL